MRILLNAPTQVNAPFSLVKSPIKRLGELRNYFNIEKLSFSGNLAVFGTPVSNERGCG